MTTLVLFRGTMALQIRIFRPSTMDSQVPQSPWLAPGDANGESTKMW